MAKSNNAYQEMFEAALAAEGVSGPLADLARSVNQQESGRGKNTGTSNAGAQGGMQIIPSTFNSVADKGWSIADPTHNARAGIRYLKQLDKQSGGDPALTAAGYYGGPGGLEKARKGIAVSDPRNPHAPNTLQYGQQVAGRLGKGSVAVPVLAQAAPQPQATPPQILAQAPVQTVLPQQVQLPEALPLVGSGQVVVQAGPDEEWAALQQAMPKQLQASDLDYGQQMAQVPRRVALSDQPDFSRFKAWGARV